MHTRSRTLAGPLVAVLAVTAAWVALRGARRAGPPAPPAPPPVAQLVGSTMGGGWSVRLARPMDAAAAASLQGSLQATLDRLDGAMSTWKPQSDLSRFNAHRGTDWHPVGADVATVAAEARRVSGQTGGAFDVTVGPLVNLWGFGPRDGPADPDARVPTDDAVHAARRHVGYRNVEVREYPPALRKLDPEVYADLSGIAQGFAADAVAVQLDEAGVADYLVEVCGELRAGGTAAGGRPWRVAVQAPVPDTLRPIRSIALPGGLSLATSGDYQNFFRDRAGRRYSHEIDPRTGRPVAHGLASVSVAHPAAAHADALATALMVLGPDDGPALARREKLAALFVVRGATGGDLETVVTPEFERLLLLPPPDPPTPPAE